MVILPAADSFLKVDVVEKALMSGFHRFQPLLIFPGSSFLVLHLIPQFASFPRAEHGRQLVELECGLHSSFQSD